MLGTLVIWGFVSAIYFKIALDASLNTSSIIGVCLLGVMVAFSVFFSAYFYAVINGKHQARVRFGQPSSTLGSSLMVLAGTLGANLIVGKLLVFGFSKTLNRTLGSDLFYNLSGWRKDESFIFMVVLAVPIIIHFISIQWSISQMTKYNRADIRNITDSQK